MPEPDMRGRVEHALSAAADVRRVRAVLALGGVPAGDLDDGLQQVRLKLVEQQADPSRPPVDNPSAWAAVTASRLAVDWHRGRTRDVRLRERLHARFERAPAVRALESDRATALDVAAVLDQLDVDHRQVVVLRYYADLKISDIAAALDVPAGTVKSRLHRAHVLLREALRDQEGA